MLQISDLLFIVIIMAYLLLMKIHLQYHYQRKCIIIIILRNIIYQMINSYDEYNESIIIPVYRLSKQYEIICNALDSYNNLISKQEGFKIQLDTLQGQLLFRDYIQYIEMLSQMLGVNRSCREYRKSFSKAYKILFKEGELGYISQILDSAQEGFPYLWVNGQKYNFSEEVLIKGDLLIDCFYKIDQTMRLFSSKIECFVQNLDLKAEKRVIACILEEFDRFWTQFQQKYIQQLMMIENQARRLIQQAIQAEKLLREYQIQQSFTGKIFLSGHQYHLLRSKVCKLIAHLNSVANPEGKGRDDLEYSILLEAEDVMSKITVNQSKAVRTIATKIRQSFENLRRVFQRYEFNLQSIDPQLKNNPDLVEALMEYQKTWEKGNHYFLDPLKKQQLLVFSEFLEATQQKYDIFREMVDCNDPNTFLIIPSLIILKNLQNEDQGLIQSFLPDLTDSKGKYYNQYSKLLNNYAQWKSTFKNGYGYYNIIEEHLIGIRSQIDNNITDMLKIIKTIAMELQRVKPLEWNNLLNAILTTEEQ